MFIINSSENCDDSIFIHFKCSKNKSIRLPLSMKDTIKGIKIKLCKQLSQLNPDEIAIVFAGKELPDDLVISSCDLANESVVNVIELKHIDKQNKQNTSSINKDANDYKILSKSLST